MQVKCKPDSDEFDNIKIEKNFSAWQNYFKQSKKTNDYVRGKKGICNLYQSQEPSFHTGGRSCKCQRKMIQAKGNEQRYLTHSSPKY